MSKLFRQKFQEAPSRVVLDLAHLKNGRYLVDGDIHQSAWIDICARACVPVSGHGSARIEIEKGTGGVVLHGQIHTKMLRQCVRTLEPFMDVQVLQLEEQFTIDNLPYQEGLGLNADPWLDLGALISEQICLGLNQYPVHPATLETPRGGYGFADNIQPQPTVEPNRPFAVLSKLKH